MTSSRMSWVLLLVAVVAGAYLCPAPAAAGYVDTGPITLGDGDTQTVTLNSSDGQIYSVWVQPRGDTVHSAPLSTSVSTNNWVISNNTEKEYPMRGNIQSVNFTFQADGGDSVTVYIEALDDS